MSKKIIYFVAGILIIGGFIFVFYVIYINYRAQKNIQNNPLPIDYLPAARPQQ